MTWKTISRRQVSNGAEATARIVGEPSEREALLTILLVIPARKCLVVISLWGAKELILPAEGWPYLYVWTVCPCIYAYVI
jgi:hypothetical protein